jgi:hypothetical protein
MQTTFQSPAPSPHKAAGDRSGKLTWWLGDWNPEQMK